MKAAPAAVLLLASATVATPTDKHYDVRRSNEVAPELRVNAGKMEVTGPIFEGGPDVTLYGTAQEVYDQILELNPHAFDNITEEDPVGTTPAKRGVLERRAKTINCKPSWGGKEVMWQSCEVNMNTLRALGNRKCSAPKNGCSRVSCTRTCAFWLCDKSKKGHWVYCRNIANDIQDIFNKCGVWYPDDWGGPSVLGEMYVGNTHATSVEWLDC